MTIAFRQQIHDILKSLPTKHLDALKQLFWTELNYNHENAPLSTRDWPEEVRDLLVDPPSIFASAGNEKDFHVIYSQLRSDRLLLGHERQIINKLIGEHDFSLFVFSDHSQTFWHFVNVKYEHSKDSGSRRIFRRITISPYEHLRTATERISLLDIARLTPDLFGVSPLVIQRQHDEAFDVEKVTKDFFRDYRTIFEQAENKIESVQDDERRIFTQLLLNRLLFIVFLERKGWLTFRDRRDYLLALWENHHKEKAKGEPVNFYRDRLKLLFFSGLNTPTSVDILSINPDGFLQSRIGQVPYLNGGLFEEEAIDKDDGIAVPDEALTPAIEKLLYHYNFTVTESTPLDIEVAVDPEMLGKIFEELVTGRRETGSYYTPKSVVAFMCQEGLKGYLETACPTEDSGVITEFVDERKAGELANPESVLSALRSVKVCDPACGSGAYMLGMMHELLDLRQALFVSKKLDARSVYDRKLEIIQRNLYGLDIDPFAVNIAHLRLWLSLIVDFEGKTPPPLPNLDFKFEVGDSLTAPDPSGGLQPDLFRDKQIQDFVKLKDEYLISHGPEKIILKERIDKLKAKIAEWSHPDGGPPGFDWVVEYVEVFSRLGKERSAMKTGFDIVLANPPYIRHELLGQKYKSILKRNYSSEVYSGLSDLYVYFYARGLQILKTDGMLSFISSNKFMRAGYGKRLRILLTKKMTISAAIDFGDLPIFEATTYPIILVGRKHRLKNDHELKALILDDITKVDHLLDVVGEDGWFQSQSSLREDGWNLVRPEALKLLEKIRSKGIPLERFTNKQIHYGIKTGLNEVLVIDRQIRDRLVSIEPGSDEVIKPWLRGRDIKKWKINWAGLYIIAIQNSADRNVEHPWANYQEDEATEIFKKVYPAIYEYLGEHEEKLRHRYDQGKYWWELRACAYYEEFNNLKIIWPNMCIEPRFTIDINKHYVSAPANILQITEDGIFLLGILNSSVVSWFMKMTAAERASGYLEYKPVYVKQIPIPEIFEDDKKIINALVRKLLGSTGNGPDIAVLEEELNKLVYKAYRLSNEEVELLEERLRSRNRKLKRNKTKKAVEALRKLK